MHKLSTGAAYTFIAAPTCVHSQGSAPAVLIVHGWNSKISGLSYTELAKRLVALNYNVMLLSLRGHEAAEGDIAEVSRVDHLADINAALTWLPEQPCVDASRLAAFGTSYGAYLLACMAPEFPSVKLMALRAPALYPNTWWNNPMEALLGNLNEVRQWRSTVRSFGDSYALKTIARFKGELLIIESGKDEDMPPQVAESYRRAASESGRVYMASLPNAAHTLGEESRKEFLDIAALWFKEHYPQTSLAA